jgi:phage tail-like protein
METQAKAAEKSVLLSYLPAIYQDPGWVGADSAQAFFLNDYLLAFEKILLGRDDGVQPQTGSDEFLGTGDRGFQGLEEKISNLQLLFDAAHSPEIFLDWLAGWGALSLNAELSESRRRGLLAHIIPLYRIRGTKKYLERMLTLFLGGNASVDDQSYPGVQIGRYSTLAKDTYLSGNAPHYFRVRLSVPLEEESRSEARQRLARDVIEQASPAHTYYDLEIVSPRLQVGVHSRVGVDTFLA